MASLDKVFKAEIRRLARSEIKSETAGIRKDVLVLKKTVADFRRRIETLEKENRSLKANTKGSVDSVAAPDPDAVKIARITAKIIKNIRQRLNLSQADFARLIEVSSLSVYLWERKSGRLSFRGDTKAKIVAARNMKKKEAMDRLASLATDTKKKRETGKKKTKTKKK